MEYKRILSFDDAGDDSLFLWGARQVGKSTLVKTVFPEAIVYDLLKSDEFERLARSYHHSTAAQAAMVARDAGVGQLMLGHYSARYDDEMPLLNEARAIFPNTILANEGLEIPVEVKKV